MRRAIEKAGFFEGLPQCSPHSRQRRFACCLIETLGKGPQYFLEAGCVTVLWFDPAAGYHVNAWHELGLTMPPPQKHLKTR